VPRLLDRKDTSEVLGVSERTIDRLRSRGELEFVRVGGQIRFEPEGIDRFIKANIQLDRAAALLAENKATS
jgi:excisionase family DNA binding protein